MALGVLAMAVLPAPAAPDPGGAPGAGDGGDAPVARADQDRDGVDDSLQAHLDGAPAAERLDVIATFHDRAGATAAQRALRPGELRHAYDIIDGFAATMTAARVRALAGDPHLRRMEFDGTVQVSMEAARADFGVDLAHERFGATGDGIGICIVDTGVDPGHEQFDTKLPIPFYDAIDGQAAAYDDHGHGTHVASIAVGDGTGGVLADRLAGVAPASTLLAAKVLGADGSGPDSGVIAGLEWCAARPDVHVISMSLGDPAVASDGLDALSQAVDHAVATDGKVAVVAAGNSGDDEGTVNAPGAAQLALTVGAAAEWSAPESMPWVSRGVYLAPFSSRGPTLDGRTKPDVMAPGVSIAAAQSGTVASYVAKSGTSMATPFVAGTAALVLAERPGLTPARVKLLAEATARDRGAPGKDDEWGAGLLDAHALVNTVADVRDFDPGHLFPWEAYHKITVPDGVTQHIEFEVTDDALGSPIAITAVLEGEAVCALPVGAECWAWEFSPDIDLALHAPDGTTWTSECPLQSDAGCGLGRQETIGVMPPVPGTYVLDVFPFAGSPNDGAGGDVAVSIQRGPIEHVDIRRPQGHDPAGATGVRVADLGGTSEPDGRVWSAMVDVVLRRGAGPWSGSAIVTGRWRHDGQVGWCTTIAGTCQLRRDGLDRGHRAVTFEVEDVAVTDRGGLVPYLPDGPRAITVSR